MGPDIEDHEWKVAMSSVSRGTEGGTIGVIMALSLTT